MSFESRRQLMGKFMNISGFSYDFKNITTLYTDHLTKQCSNLQTGLKNNEVSAQTLTKINYLVNVDAFQICYRKQRMLFTPYNLLMKKLLVVYPDVRTALRVL
jgi:hypothetical protein